MHAYEWRCARLNSIRISKMCVSHFMITNSTVDITVTKVSSGWKYIYRESKKWYYACQYHRKTHASEAHDLNGFINYTISSFPFSFCSVSLQQQRTAIFRFHFLTFSVCLHCVAAAAAASSMQWCMCR